MDFGYTDGDDQVSLRKQLDLGSNFMARQAAPTPSAMIADHELLRRFVDLVKQSPEFGWQAGKALGLRAFETPAESPDPMPRSGVVSIEATFGDRGPSKAKRQRKEQAGARFDVTLQVSTTSSRGVSSPTFRGRADFYDPERALAKARELAKPTKCRTPFTPEYLAFIAQVAEGAEGNDMLVGLLHTKPETGGTFYHHGQMVLASRSGLERHSLENVVVLLDGDKGLVSFALPPTSTNTSKGNALASKFVMQSRGEAKAGAIGNSWATGIFQMRKH